MLELKAFSPSRINYIRCYFDDLFTIISVVAAMLPIMVQVKGPQKAKCFLRFCQSQEIWSDT